ncbi:MAG TPA: hypothetical protein VJ249_07225 [Candidatus Bathyarchaeia archaeon]|nr:hypothetical protein [Candidatus Bathyarchaeia archaeon]
MKQLSPINAEDSLLLCVHLRLFKPLPAATNILGVDVTRNTLTTTSIQLQLQNASQHGRRRLKGKGAFFF